MARFGRAQALQQLHRIEDAVDEYGRCLAINPQHHEARSQQLLARQYLDQSRDRLLEEHVAYGLAVGLPVERNFSNSRIPSRRLRVAWLSPDLRAHAGASFIEPLFQCLNPDEFEVYLYHDRLHEDDASRRLTRHAALWRNFVGQPDAVIESTILTDAPDIRYHAPFEEMVRAGWLPGFVEIYIRRDLQLQLSRM